MSKNNFHSPLLIITVVIILGIFSVIKPVPFFDINFKQINIFSGIIPDSILNSLWRQEFVGVHYSEIKDIKNSNSHGFVINSLLPYTHKNKIMISIDSTSNINTSTVDIVDVDDIISSPRKHIQDFSKNEEMMNSFINRLSESDKRNVRIAVMGDSFIEGDIMIEDLREMFQSEYSGGGVGFMPIVSPSPRYRKTIKHQFSDNWNVESIIKNKKSSNFTLSGLIFIPQEESWVQYEPTKYKKHAAQINQAQLLFINQKNAIVEVVINDEEPIYYEPDSSALLQVITISRSIEKIRYSFSNIDGLSLYGAVLDAGVSGVSGVSIDNYSIRGNRGTSMTDIDIGLSAQLNVIMPYDLIVLEYGQNILHKDQPNYRGYDRYFKRIIDHIKRCYPKTPILLMGISDRSAVKHGKAVVFTGVLELDRLQCKAAQESEVLFWSTLSVMQSLGGMGEFVKNGWAAKDYVHLSRKGGSIIAAELYNAMVTTDSTTVLVANILPCNNIMLIADSIDYLQYNNSSCMIK